MFGSCTNVWHCCYIAPCKWLYQPCPHILKCSSAEDFCIVAYLLQKNLQLLFTIQNRSEWAGRKIVDCNLMSAFNEFNIHLSQFVWTALKSSVKWYLVCLLNLGHLRIIMRVYVQFVLT